jgi:hypothetical protein
MAVRAMEEDMERHPENYVEEDPFDFYDEEEERLWAERRERESWND